MDWANDTFVKDIKVVCLGHNSHMFNSWTFIDWLNTDCRYEVNKQRQRYSEPMTMPYYLIFDMGPDHTAWKDGQQLRIEQISKELNMILKCMPAGGSAHGQPADQIHNLIHAYNRMWQMRRTQTYDNIYLRPQFNGEPDIIRAMSNRDSVQAEVWAKRRLALHVCILAWVNTGYYTVEEASANANDTLGMDLEELKREFMRFRKSEKAVREDQLDISVAETGEANDVLPAIDQQVTVWKLAYPYEGKDATADHTTWRALHIGLQNALHRESCRRKCHRDNSDALKITDQTLANTRFVDLFFLGKHEVFGDRVEALQKNKKASKLLRKYVFDSDDFRFTLPHTKDSFELRKMNHPARQPLDFNEPTDLPEHADHLAAMYALDIKPDVDTDDKAIDSPVDADAGINAKGVDIDKPDAGEGFADCDGDFDAGGQFGDTDTGKVEESDLWLERIEKQESLALEQVQTRRRLARTGKLKFSKLNEGWVQYNDVMMYPFLVNPHNLPAPAPPSQVVTQDNQGGAASGSSIGPATAAGDDGNHKSPSSSSSSQSDTTEESGHDEALMYSAPKFVLMVKQHASNCIAEILEGNSYFLVSQRLEHLVGARVAIGISGPFPLLVYVLVGPCPLRDPQAQPITYGGGGVPWLWDGAP